MAPAPRDLLLLFISVLLVSACDSSTAPQSPPDRIDFSRLEVGQRSTYAGFTGEDYAARRNLNMEYTNQVLIVEVVAETDTGFVFREHVEPGSPDDRTDQVYEWGGRMVGDTLQRFPLAGAYLQSYLLPDPIVDMREIDGVEAEIISWVTSIPYCECYVEGHVLNYTRRLRRYDRLNLIVDDRAMQVDLNGHTYLYSREAGFVRVSSASWWTRRGMGWELR